MPVKPQPTKISERALAAIPTRFPMPQSVVEHAIDSGRWRVLCETIFPSARSADAIVMALDYCKARGLDVFKRPVHIVPMWNSTLRKEVETVWPGINEIQTTAARTKAWAGMDEPKWGPDTTLEFEGKTREWDEEAKERVWKTRKVTVTFPEWCSVTVYRMIDGQRCPFTEPVYWLEAYSRAGGKSSELPTEMWQKRPRGQLHKVAKAASLRAGFPEDSDYSAEEMEGKSIEAGGIVIEHEAEQKPEPKTVTAGKIDYPAPSTAAPAAEPPQEQTPAEEKPPQPTSATPLPRGPFVPAGFEAPANPYWPKALNPVNPMDIPHEKSEPIEEPKSPVITDFWHSRTKDQIRASFEAAAGQGMAKLREQWDTLPTDMQNIWRDVANNKWKPIAVAVEEQRRAEQHEDM